jgi:SRSO17 transposase
MHPVDKLATYLNYLCEGLGHVNRHQKLIDYCSALMLPIERKSVEPMAAVVDPHNVRQQHQSLHHFVADSAWSDRAILDRCWQWVHSRIADEEPRYWIVDDTGIPKKGHHSVGVSHQYCGQLGKQANCQVAVSLSVATEQVSLPIDYRLYLPESWAEDVKRREAVGVPKQIEFATKPQIALKQLQAACQRSEGRAIVLADAAYGNNNEFRNGLDELGLSYVVGVNPNTGVWPRGVKPLPPKAPSGNKGRRSTRQRYAKGHEPQSCEQLALTLTEDKWQHVQWREGTNKPLSCWFCAVRVRVAHRDQWHSKLRPTQWLLMQWPEGEQAPTRYWLSTLPRSTTLTELVHSAKMRWRIERDYQELKDELGLNHYEGRNWRGFHHHATLCIAAYAYLVGERLAHPHQRKKNVPPFSELTVPEDYIPRGSPARTTSC